VGCNTSSEFPDPLNGIHNRAILWQKQQYEKFYWPSLKKVMDALINEGLICMMFAEGSHNMRLEIIKDLRTLKKRVHQIMGHKPITASKDHTIKDAAVMMLNGKISCLSIVSSDGTIEGIVTWKDILKWLVREVID
jgi:predicted transcriptional regulator